MFGFLPTGLPATRFHPAWLGRLLGIRWDCLAAAGAIPQGCGAFFGRGHGLAFQALLEHLLGEHFPNLDDEVFEFGQLGPPAGTLGSPNAVRKVFGHTLEVSTNFFYLGTPFFVACHPLLLLEVEANVETNLPRKSTMSLGCLANHVLHPNRRETAN